MTSVTFTGLSGQRYQYIVCSMDGSWNAIAGNYVFAYLTSLGWVSVYFGETGNFATRFPGHEKWRLAMLCGATHVLAHVTLGGEAVRQAEEKDLIRAYNPVCNIEYRSTGFGLLNRPLGTGATLLSGRALPKRRAGLLNGL